ncbi:MAG: AAA family ATPase [Akkermansia sp.]
MLASLSIHNFKSLQNFQIEFPNKLCVLIGLNGSGKSTVLQGIDFLTALTKKEGVSRWLAGRGWTKPDLFTSLSITPFSISRRRRFSPVITFSMVTELENVESYKWEGMYNGNTGKCTKETIDWRDQNSGSDDRSIELSEGILKNVGDNQFQPINLTPIDYQGSFLSVVKAENPPYNCPPYDMRQHVESILSIDLLSPLQMRRRVREFSMDGVGLGGEQLSLFLHSLSSDQKHRLKEVMIRFYPHFDSFETVPMRGGWKKLTVKETYNASNLNTESRHLNDGMLRILAIVAETLFFKGTVLIDEIEDGINPELLEKLTAYLLEDCPCQVITTTHSPLLLNFIPDDNAKEIVQFVYKTAQGISRAVPLFKIPKIAESLGMLGAGEVMLQYNMEDVACMAEKMNPLALK